MTPEVSLDYRCGACGGRMEETIDRRPTSYRDFVDQVLGAHRKRCPARYGPIDPPFNVARAKLDSMAESVREIIEFLTTGDHDPGERRQREAVNLMEISASLMARAQTLLDPEKVA